MTANDVAKQARFLRLEYVPLLSTIDPERPRRWGKLSLQGTIEHMADSVRIANLRDPHEQHLPDEVVLKMQQFLRSDKKFRENTENKLMSAEPAALRNGSIAEACVGLQSEIDEFFRLHEATPSLRVMNPFFGALDFELWVRLLHRHAWHHLNQYGVEEPAAEIGEESPT